MHLCNVRCFLFLVFFLYITLPCLHFYRTFCGREDLLSSMREYVIQRPGKPLVVHGVSGSGKTSAMAMLVNNVREWLGENYVVVFRFLGTSAQSSTIHETLQSITKQVSIL